MILALLPSCRYANVVTAKPRHRPELADVSKGTTRQCYRGSIVRQ